MNTAVGGQTRTDWAGVDSVSGGAEKAVACRGSGRVVPSGLRWTLLGLWKRRSRR